MTEQHPRPFVALVMVNNTGIGGAERRFARVYEGLRRRHAPVALVINEFLLARLREGGILTSTGEPALVIRSRTGRVANALRRFVNPTNRAAAFLLFWLRKLDYGLYALSFWWWLARTRPRVLHLVLGGVYLAVPLQLLRCAPPVVVSVVNPGLRTMVGSIWGVWLYRLSLRRARVVDALSYSIGEMLKEEGVEPRRIHVSAGSCVDTSRFQPAAVKRPWVVFSGRLIQEKNPMLFVEACALVRQRLRDRQPELRFLLLGDGPLRAEVERLVQRYGFKDCMQVGWADDMESILGKARVFVSLQRTDNYPSQALLEGMASGMAVVATDVGLTWKLVDNAVGRLVSAEPTAVADAIVELLENPDLAAAMGRRARERVVRDHSMDAYLDYVEGLYTDAC